MRYRLICVIDTENPRNGVSIETGMDSASRMLVPFKRQVTVDELMKSEGAEKEALIRLLFGLGFSTQPFRITGIQLQNASVQEALMQCHWTYVRKGEKGSLKRVESLAPYLPRLSDTAYPTGQLLTGELYVISLQNWTDNVRIRFRYQDCTRNFPIGYEDVPYEAENKYYERDSIMEGRLLAMLGKDSINAAASTATIAETGLLKGLLENGWKLYVPGGSRSHSSLQFRSNNGIDWFGGADSAGLAENQEMLQAFLRGKDYVEADGDIVLIDRKSIKKAGPSALSSILFPSLDLGRLFRHPHRLSEEDKERIGSSLENDVHAILKPYQIEGVHWLLEMRENGLGCLLADEMGLGKTLQILAYLTVLPRGLRFLVVCPASVVPNWEREMAKFSPHLKGQLEVASYDSVRLNISDYKNRKYDTLVIDESQMVKNASTQRFHAVSELDRKHTIMLSGTPIENNVQELWSQFKVLLPEAKMLEARINELGPEPEAFIDLSKKILSPFILRRTKKEVELRLPELREHEIKISLSEAERRIYDRIRSIFLTGLKSGATGQANFLALECLTRLRICCVSPNLVPQCITQSGKLMSTKMKEAMSFTEEKLLEGHRIIIFSQFAKAIHELQGYLEKAGIPSLALTGTTANRQKLIDRFQSKKQENVFLISLKAGGAGINLTAADTILFLDDWWNPSVESQAMSRAHRIGQDKDTDVYRIVCRDTVEEKILELHQEKKEIADLFHAENAHLTFEEIKSLIL